MLVKIKFQSAKLPFYRSENGPVDRVGDNEPRPKCQIVGSVSCGNPFGTAKNVIHYEQISNMLAAMIGERPVSFFHTPVVDGVPVRKRPEVLDGIAKNGYVKVKGLHYFEKDDKLHYITENSTYRKSGGSNSKVCSTITWRKFRNRFRTDSEKLEKYMECFKRYTPKEFSEEFYGSINEAICDIEASGRLEEFKNEIGCDGLFAKSTDVLRPGKSSRFAFISSDTYPMKTITVSGEFVFDVPEDIYKRLVFGVKIATYLDGGLATLEKWEETGTYNGDGFVDEYDIIDNGFVKVSEIDKRD